MTHSISCVLLIPTAHRDAVNQLAASLGYGPNNLSVPLDHADGSIWYGCHTWCAQSFLDQLADPLYAGEVLNALVVSTAVGGDPTQHWAEVLTEHNLSPAT